jgi:peptidoglycan/xylan/chitin deacetylase (PgdA/CDA1 family)
MKIVQCWDDGVRDDIRLTEILRRHGAKASFNLNWASHINPEDHAWKHKDHDVTRLLRSELREVYDGFLVANHSMNHPFLKQIAPEAAEREIRENRDALEQHFGYEVTGFAYPFGSYNQTVMDLVRDSGHVYARTCENAAQVFPPADAMALATNCHFAAPDFWERFATAGEVFYFWGHSYEMTTEDEWAAFESKIARLSATPDAQWANLPGLFTPSSLPNATT